MPILAYPQRWPFLEKWQDLSGPKTKLLVRIWIIQNSRYQSEAAPDGIICHAKIRE